MSDRAITILIFIVVAAVMGVLGERYFIRSNQPEQAQQHAPKQKVKQETAVFVQVTRCERKNGRTEMTGHIVNVGNTDLHYVTVDAIWKDGAGLPIKTDRLYALNNGDLAPNESKEFHAFTELPAARCNAEAVDWW